MPIAALAMFFFSSFHCFGNFCCTSINAFKYEKWLFCGFSACCSITNHIHSFASERPVHVFTDAVSLETVKDFLIKLDMKPNMHLVKISIFLLNDVTVRLTKIMNNLLKHLKILMFKVNFLC